MSDDPRTYWWERWLRPHYVAAFIVLQVLAVTCTVAAVEHIDRTHQIADQQRELRLIQTELATMRGVGNEFNTHATASARRDCANAAMIRYAAGLNMNLTKLQHARLQAYVQTACSYTLPAGRSSICPVPPKDAIPATQQAETSTALGYGTGLRLLNDLVRGKSMERAAVFHKEGATKHSSKIALGSVDDALDARLEGGGGPYRMGRFSNTTARTVVDYGPWKTQGKAVTDFAARIRSEGHVGTVYRVESQTRKDWAWRIRIVEWTQGEQIIAAAKSQLGVKYVWGDADPKGGGSEGFDCSGLTAWAYQVTGAANLPHNAEAQRQLCKPLPSEQKPKPGMLVFWDFNGAGYATHVGLWLKPGYVIDTRSPDGEPVAVRPIEGPPYLIGIYEVPGVNYG